MSKWMPTGLGAEPKKVMILIGLLALSPVAYYYGTSSDTPVTPASSAPKAPRTTIPVVEPVAVQRPRVASRAARSNTDDFRPSLNLPEDFDLSKVDPTLRTDLLAKVREVEAGSSRSLFEFYTPPPPPPPKVDPIKPTAPKEDPFAKAEPPKPVTPPPPPPPPPIPLKYFGYEGTPRGGAKLRALFVEGEDYYVVGENDLIKNRYRIVRIGTTSAEVEDTTSKNKQTLRILDRQDP